MNCFIILRCVRYYIVANEEQKEGIETATALLFHTLEESFYELVMLLNLNNWAKYFANINRASKR